MAKFYYDLSDAVGGLLPSSMGGNNSSDLTGHLLAGWHGAKTGLYSKSVTGSSVLVSTTDLLDADVQVLYRATGSTELPASNSDDGGNAVILRATGFNTSGLPDDCYLIALNGQTTLPGDNVSLSLFKVEAGSKTKLGSTVNNAIAPNTFDDDVLIRAEIYGGDIKAKVWLSTEAEPSTWDIEETDATHTAGRCGFALHGNGMVQISQYFSVGTLGDPAPDAPAPDVGGGNSRTYSNIIRRPDKTGMPGVKVRAYDRDTGNLLAETTSNASGGFTLTFSTVSPTSPFYVVGVDTVGNTWRLATKDNIVE